MMKIIFVQVILSLVSSLPADITTGLIGYWMLDEGSGTTFKDQTVNKLDGKVSSGVWTTGKFGKALEYNGQTISRITFGPAMNEADTALTAACWVNLTSADQSTRIFFNRPAGTTLFETWCLAIQNGKWLAGITAKPSWDQLSSVLGGTIDAAKWRHVAMTFNASGAILYVDGEKSAEMTPLLKKLDYTGNFDICIGANLNNGTELVHGFIGKLDELRLYKRALTGADIEELSKYDPYGTAINSLFPPAGAPFHAGRNDTESARCLDPLGRILDLESRAGASPFPRLTVIIRK